MTGVFQEEDAMLTVHSTEILMKGEDGTISCAAADGGALIKITLSKRIVALVCGITLFNLACFTFNKDPENSPTVVQENSGVLPFEELAEISSSSDEPSFANPHRNHGPSFDNPPRKHTPRRISGIMPPVGTNDGSINPCNEGDELFEDLCYKSCSIATYGKFPVRAAPCTCCKTEECEESMTRCDGLGQVHEPNPLDIETCNICAADEEYFMGFCFKSCKVLTHGWLPFRLSTCACCDGCTTGDCLDNLKASDLSCAKYSIDSFHNQPRLPETISSSSCNPCAPGEELFQDLCYRTCASFYQGVWPIRTGPSTCCMEEPCSTWFLRTETQFNQPRVMVRRIPSKIYRTGPSGEKVGNSPPMVTGGLPEFKPGYGEDIPSPENTDKTIDFSKATGSERSSVTGDNTADAIDFSKPPSKPKDGSVSPSHDVVANDDLEASGEDLSTSSLGRPGNLTAVDDGAVSNKMLVASQVSPDKSMRALTYQSGRK